MFLQRGKREKSIGRAGDYLQRHTWDETRAFNASHLSISSAVSGPDVVPGSWKMSRTERSKRWRVEIILRAPTVGIISLVVHHQFVVHKVEAVRLRLVRV